MLQFTNLSAVRVIIEITVVISLRHGDVSVKLYQTRSVNRAVIINFGSLNLLMNTVGTTRRKFINCESGWRHKVTSAVFRSHYCITS